MRSSATLAATSNDVVTNASCIQRNTSHFFQRTVEDMVILIKISIGSVFAAVSVSNALSHGPFVISNLTIDTTPELSNTVELQCSYPRDPLRKYYLHVRSEAAKPDQAMYLFS